MAQIAVQASNIQTKVLTVREVSEYLRVHPSTIYRMLRRRRLPAFRVGCYWRFNIEEIERWCATLEAGLSYSMTRPAGPGLFRRDSERWQNDQSYYWRSHYGISKVDTAIGSRGHKLRQGRVRCRWNHGRTPFAKRPSAQRPSEG